VTNPSTKHDLRSSIKRTLDQMTHGDRSTASIQISTQITTSDLYRSSTAILAYASLPTEICLDPLIHHALDAGKLVCVPSVDWDKKTMHPVQIRSLDKDLQIGRYDLRSPREGCKPIPSDRMTLALIPGLGFDASCRRLGRGAGFYVRWIEQRLACDQPITLVGVCFDEQLVERIPTDPHDQAMDLIVTPTRTYER
jgi:5-formyltetrahydrofolate cyclo-ligase